MRVVVTGSSGRLASVLLPRLFALAQVREVVGIDRIAPRLRNAKFRPLIADIAEPAARSALRGADALVHLAFVLLRGRMTPWEMERRNVAGTERLLEGAAAVPIIVHVSTAAVYGSGVALRESAPLAPLAEFHYARQKVAVERWIAGHLPRAAVLRPHVILGPHALPLLKRLARLPFYVRLPEPRPLLQCVHEQDVADAIVAALLRSASGPFNLAAPAPFSLRDAILSRYPRAPGIPLAAARALFTAVWRTTGWGGEPGWLEGLAQPLTLNCEKARGALGWAPRYEDWRAIVASCRVAS